MPKGNQWIAIYVRLSIEDEGHIEQSGSIKNQLELLYQYINRKDEWKNIEVKEYCDDGYRGTNFHRPSFMKLIEDVRNKKIACILVKDLSRFGRDYLVVGNYLENVFPSLGVRFISVNDGFDSVKEQKQLNMDIAFKNLLNAYYSKDLSVKVKSTLDEKKRKGLLVGNLFGYIKSKEQRGQLIIDKESADIVRKIFQKALEGKGSTVIADELNKERTPTPSTYKRQRGIENKVTKVQLENIWNRHSVAKILRDERYTGKYINYIAKEGNMTYGKRNDELLSERIVIENHHESIISEEEFIQAQSIMNQYVKKTYERNENNIFRGKVKCGHCGYALERTEYKCKNKADNSAMLYGNHKGSKDIFGCSEIKIKESVIEDIVLSELKKLSELALEEEKLFEQIFSKKNLEGKNIQKEVHKLRRKEEELTEQKMYLYEDYREGKLDKEEYLNRKNQVGEDLEKLNVELDVLEKWETKNAEEESRGKNEFVKKIKDKGEGGKLTYEIVEEVIEQIRVYDGSRVEIKWKLGDKEINIHKIV